MRSLKLSPLKFDIEFWCCSAVREGEHISGHMEAGFRFGETTGSHCFSEDELVAIGKWFFAAAKRIQKVQR